MIIIIMKNLKKEYYINRYDIKTSEKLILKKYFEVINIFKLQKIYNLKYHLNA